MTKGLLLIASRLRAFYTECSTPASNRDRQNPGDRAPRLNQRQLASLDMSRVELGADDHR